MKEETSKFKLSVNSQINELTKKLMQREKQIQELTTSLTSQTKDLENVTKELGTLRGAMTGINSQVNAYAWKNFRNECKEKRTLVIGSSIIRDMSKTQLENTDLTCISGGRIKDIAAEVNKTPSDKYERIILVAGGNDCEPRDPSTKVSPADIVDQYKSLVDICKQKTPLVTVSSICPRNSKEEVRNRIDSVNAGIQVLCGDENVDYVDNNLSFYLKDKSINDAYLLDDGIHLTYKGTNRLAQNLNLKLKNGEKTVCDFHSHKRSQRRKKYESLNTEPDTASNDEENLDHLFWRRAHYKAKTSANQSVMKYSTSPSSYSPKMENRYTRQGEMRCYFCYESNHTRRSWRHEKPLVCNTCGAEGHKAKHH